MAGFNFGFFGDQEHRVFNYKPRYYDPEKEALKAKFGDVDGTNEKNWRAYDRVRHDWSMVFNLINCGLPVYQPAAMDYDLRNYIYYIRKMRCGGNYEHVPNSDPSVEPMGGVEETGLDDSVVEETADISRNHS